MTGVRGDDPEAYQPTKHPAAGARPTTDSSVAKIVRDAMSDFRARSRLLAVPPGTASVVRSGASPTPRRGWDSQP